MRAGGRWRSARTARPLIFGAAGGSLQWPLILLFLMSARRCLASRQPLRSGRATGNAILNGSRPLFSSDPADFAPPARARCTRRRISLSQYARHDFRRTVKGLGFVPRLSSKGNCWNNAVAESFFPLLKRERIGRRVYPDRNTTREDIFSYIEMSYNRHRKHGYSDMLSPVDYKKRCFRKLGAIHNRQAAILAAPIVKGVVGYAEVTADVIDRSPRCMLLDGGNNVRFGKTFLHSC